MIDSVLWASAFARQYVKPRNPKARGARRTGDHNFDSPRRLVDVDPFRRPPLPEPFALDWRLKVILSKIALRTGMSKVSVRTTTAGEGGDMAVKGTGLRFRLDFDVDVGVDGGLRRGEEERI